MRHVEVGLCACLLVASAGLAADDTRVARQKGKAADKATIVHSVYFWLNDEATDENAKSLISDCKGLAALDCVLAVHAGTPLGKSRGVVDSSYRVGIVVYFADKAAYDTYLPHPKHQALVKKHSALWKKVIVYDFIKQ